MKKIVFLLALVFAFTSCQKEAIEPEPQPVPVPVPIQTGLGFGNDGTSQYPKFAMRHWGECASFDIDSIVFTNITKDYRKMSDSLNSWNGVIIITTPNTPYMGDTPTSANPCTGIVDGWIQYSQGYSNVGFGFPEAFINNGDSCRLEVFYSEIGEHGCALDIGSNYLSGMTIPLPNHQPISHFSYDFWYSE